MIVNRACVINFVIFIQLRWDFFYYIMKEWNILQHVNLMKNLVSKKLKTLLADNIAMIVRF